LSFDIEDQRYEGVEDSGLQSYGRSIDNGFRMGDYFVGGNASEGVISSVLAA
jgi:hypothetical protein